MGDGGHVTPRKGCVEMQETEDTEGPTASARTSLGGQLSQQLQLLIRTNQREPTCPPNRS